MNSNNQKSWFWASFLSFAGALPYAAVAVLSLVLYKRLGLDNARITVLGCSMQLPWVFRSLVRNSKLLRKFPCQSILLSQAIAACCLLGIGYSIGGPNPELLTFPFFCFLACCMVVHSCATSLLTRQITNPHTRHLQHAAHRIGTLFAAGILVMLAGGLETLLGKVPLSWKYTFFLLGAIMLVILIIHASILPYNKLKHTASNTSGSLFKGLQTLVCQPHSAAVFLFILVYQLPKALLIRIIPLFLLDTASQEGCALSTQELGLCFGTVGLLAMSAGGVIGFQHLCKKGIKKCTGIMAWCMSLPCIGFIVISLFQIDSFLVCTLFVGIEEFCYGYGLTAYLQFLNKYTKNKPQNQVHWCKILASLAFIIPGYFSGMIQMSLGYIGFFLLILAFGVITRKVAHVAINQ